MKKKIICTSGKNPTRRDYDLTQLSMSGKEKICFIYIKEPPLGYL